MSGFVDSVFQVLWSPLSTKCNVTGCPLNAHSEADFRMHSKFIIHFSDALETFFKEICAFLEASRFSKYRTVQQDALHKSGPSQAAKHLEILEKYKSKTS